MSLPKKGDILYVKRPLYEHYGVYIGEGKVIHFAAKEGAETNAAQADIYETTVSDFLKEGELFVLKDPDGFSPLPPDEIVKRAKSKVGKCKGEYNLVSNNCEHFAYWCRYGESHSQQVENVADLLVSVGFFPLTILHFMEKFFGFGKNDSIEEMNLLKFGDVISFFKEPSRLFKLQNNPEYIAACIKEDMDNGKHFVVCCVFNKSTNEIADEETDCKMIVAKELDDDIKNAFGDKPMIVLK